MDLAAVIGLRLAFNYPSSTDSAFQLSTTSDIILPYYARPVFPVKNFNYEAAYNGLLTRTPSPPNLGCSVKEVNVFKARFANLASDNELFSLVMKPGITSEEIARIGYKYASFSMLFPLKHFLIHHPQQAREYRGFIPFGSQVRSFINHNPRAFGGWVVDSSPSYRDHVMLQTITNYMADEWNIPSVSVNNLMYLEGQEISSGN